MVTWVQTIKRTLKLLLVITGLLALQQEELHAQVQFFTAPPDIDSFPVVKTKVSIAYNGRPAPIAKSNLSIQEDGQNTDFELLDCDESEAASIAVLFDVSESMAVTLFRGNDEFYRAFVDFTLELTLTSEVALVPFNDSVRRIIPASYRSQDFFQWDQPADVAEFLDSVGGLQFKGNTNVDLGIWKAAEHLRKGANRRKAIILVTDDGIYDREALIELLRQVEISLFVLELDADTIKGNLVTANETGGKFYSPKDSTELGQTMSLIARSIYAKKCTLRYVSTHPCPWWSTKTLWIGLNYQKQSLAETHYFKLGPNRRDTVAPILTETPVGSASIIVRADENFPCDVGIKSLTDSALVNFAKISRVRSLPQFGYDSLVIIDLSQPADGYYIAIDSNGNRSQLRISYAPEPDRLSPQWNLPIKIAPEQYQLTATEFRKWDRGLREVALAPGSSNIRLDSLIYASSRLAQVYLSRIDPAMPASACVVAIDSVDNDSSICITFDVSITDNNPPFITQRPSESPYSSMIADVTELRSGDRGILSITVTPVSNVTASSTNFTSAFIADVTVPITDSLYDADAIVTAVDSLGNASQLTLRYSPQPDGLGPRTLITVDDLATQTLAITETQAWDRGIASVAIISSSNVNPSQLTDTRRSSDWRFVAIDPFIDGIAKVEAIDSAGNPTTIDITIPAQSPPVELPLAYMDLLDFGTVQSPALVKLSVDVINPNDGPVSILRGSLTGDDSVFSLATMLPSVFGPAGATSLGFNFNPKLLGDWSAIYTIETDNGVKYPIRLRGSSMGVVTVDASDESVSLSGEFGVLSLDVSGSPDVINLDTVRFVLAVDDDVAALTAPSNTCANSDWICNYNVQWSELARGSYALELTRVSSLRSLEFSTSPTLSIPFRTFMSGKLRTDVRISDLKASRSLTSMEQGSIVIGQSCGDSIIVAALVDQVAGIRALQTNGNGTIQLEYFSAVDDQITLMLVNLIGLTCIQSSISVTGGLNSAILPIHDLVSGSYRFVLSSQTGIYSRAINIVR